MERNRNVWTLRRIGNEVLRLRKRQAGQRVQPPTESPEGVHQLLPRLPAEAVAKVGLWEARMTPRCYNGGPFVDPRAGKGV